LASAEVDIDRAADRLKFEQAVTELRSGAGPRYKRLRAELNDYPLALYLDALVIEGDLHHTKPDVIKAFLGRAVDSPVALRTLRSFVRHKVKDRHWKTVVDVTQHVGLPTELRCHRAHALLMTQQIEEATTLLTGLWSVGKSQIKACDPVFKAWYRHSGPSDDVVWQRALRAADARNTTLLRYLRKFASANAFGKSAGSGRDLYATGSRDSENTRVNPTATRYCRNGP
jgi:soluble lytic murein transglycosylase